MKPILFNTEMVRAILDGRKTVTRRKVDIDIINSCDIDVDGSIISVQDEYGDFHSIMDHAPYQVGDVLYVRETWNYGYFDSSDIEYSNSQYFEELRKTDGEFLKAISNYIYRADFTEREEYEYGMENKKGERIKMP